MKTILAGIGFVVVVIVLILFAVCHDDDDNNQNNGWAPAVTQLAYHDGGDCWDEYDCRGRDYGDDGGRDSYRQEYGNRGDQSRCRGRGCRGSFSPGPFDRSPVTIIVCPPGTQYCGSDGGRGQDQPPADEEPQSVSCLIPVPYHCDPRTA